MEMKIQSGCTGHTLLKNGFREYSDYTYKLTIPLHKSSNNIPIIEAVIYASLEDMVLNIDVYDRDSKSLYTPFYNIEYGKNTFCKNIRDKVDRIINRLIKNNVLGE